MMPQHTDTALTLGCRQGILQYIQQGVCACEQCGGKRRARKQVSVCIKVVLTLMQAEFAMWLLHPNNHSIHYICNYRLYHLHHHTVQAACMQVMSLTRYILAHSIAVTNRPSGGAPNIVVGKGSVNDCNEGVFYCDVEPIKIDNAGIGSVTSAGTANSTPQFISGVGTTPCRARTWTVY